MLHFGMMQLHKWFCNTKNGIVGKVMFHIPFLAILLPVLHISSVECLKLVMRYSYFPRWYDASYFVSVDASFYYYFCLNFSKYCIPNTAFW